jgi:hypothetical protein
MIRETIDPIWSGEACIVAATGPSLTAEVARRCLASQHRVLAVSDAWRLMPWATALYSCDHAWWQHHQGATGFGGEKWSSHGTVGNEKVLAAERWGLNLVRGKDGKGFSTDPAVIHYGGNSGFQAVNLAILFGAVRIVLVGFNLRHVGEKSHFFGDHPGRLRTCSRYQTFLGAFRTAAKTLPPGVVIVNATPNSALDCFPRLDLDEALNAKEAVG